MGDKKLDCVVEIQLFGKESIQPQSIYQNTPESALFEVLVFDRALR